MCTTLIEVGDVTTWQDSAGEPHHTRTRRFNFFARLPGFDPVISGYQWLALQPGRYGTQENQV